MGVIKSSNACVCMSGGGGSGGEWRSAPPTAAARVAMGKAALPTAVVKQRGVGVEARPSQ